MNFNIEWISTLNVNLKNQKLMYNIQWSINWHLFHSNQRWVLCHL